MSTLIHLQRNKKGSWDVTELVSSGRQIVVRELDGDYVHVVTEEDNYHHYGACKDEHGKS